MEMTRILLDTNAFSSYVNQDKKIIDQMLKSDKVYLSVISSGELVAGFLKGTKFEYNNITLEKFLKNSKVQLLNISKNTSDIYGKIYYELQKNGLLIPINDVWIAACAIETDSVLVTYDKHFLSIPKLKLWDKIE